MADDERLDNEGHAMALKWIENGKAVMVSDEHWPRGRFQVTACLQGGDVILSEWREDAAGDWYSRRAMFLKRGAIQRLSRLLAPDA